MLVLAPMASMVATAMGFSGEHVHYDRTWHSAAEWASATATAHDADHDGHADPGTHGDHDNDHDGAPIKHSHADQVHAIAFVIVNAPQLVFPDMNVATALAPASIPLQQHSYPPFRPPQVA